MPRTRPAALTLYEAPASVAGDPAVVRDCVYDGDGLRADLVWDSTGACRSSSAIARACTSP
jgi:hypothetical protein